MTVTYTSEVTHSSFGCFLKLLLRWRGSIYKIVWMDLFAFLFIYYLLSLSYRYLMNRGAQIYFELLVNYCHNSGTLIPLSFVLGFYVSIVMNRWWQQYMTVPWPDRLAVYVSTLMVGQDERGRVMRRTMMRYVCLCLTMSFTMITRSVKKRFPTMDHLITAGLLTENENDVLKRLDDLQAKHEKHWVPLLWATSIVCRARREGRIRDDFSLKTLIDELDLIRSQCAQIIRFDSVPIPLVYTQSVTVAVYAYFLAAVFGQQFTDTIHEDGHYNLVDYYFPLFTTLEFFFYMGWLKVAESLMNPFGEDDDDFEMNWLIDRNIQVSYLIVDEMHHEHPELVRDQYWDDVLPESLPYPLHLSDMREEPPQPSTAHLDPVKEDNRGIEDQDNTVRLVWNRPDTYHTSFNSSISLFNNGLRNFQSSEGFDNDNNSVRRTSASQESANNTATDNNNNNRARHTTGSILSHESGNISAANDYNMATDKTVTEPRTSALERESSKPSRATMKASEAKPIVRESEGEMDRNETVGKNEFELLCEQREQERLERHRQRIMQNVITATSATAGLPPDQLPTVIISATYISPIASGSKMQEQAPSEVQPESQHVEESEQDQRQSVAMRDDTDQKADEKTEQE